MTEGRHVNVIRVLTSFPLHRRFLFAIRAQSSKNSRESKIMDDFIGNVKSIQTRLTGDDVASTGTRPRLTPEMREVFDDSVLFLFCSILFSTVHLSF